MWRCATNSMECKLGGLGEEKLFFVNMKFHDNLRILRDFGTDFDGNFGLKIFVSVLVQCGGVPQAIWSVIESIWA